MCKAHKRKWEKRWNNRDLTRLKEFEKEKFSHENKIIKDI